MELRHLRYFIAVAEECSFSRAAEKLHVSQPPLSRQIRDLESELGVKLLDRNRQGVRLTRLGNAVLARARALIRDADSFKAEATLLDKQVHEELQVGYAPSPTAVSISKVLAKYHGLAPGGRITLQDLTHTQILLALKKKKLHAALTLRPREKEMRGLRFELISRHRVGIVCSPESSFASNETVRPSNIASQELIVYRANDFPEYHRWIAGILGISIGTLVTSQECDDVLGVIAAVESGRGVAIVGEFIYRGRWKPCPFCPFFLKGTLSRGRGFVQTKWTNREYQKTDCRLHSR